MTNHWLLAASLMLASLVLPACSSGDAPRRMPPEVKPAYNQWRKDSLAAAKKGQRAEPRAALYLIRDLRAYVKEQPRTRQAPQMLFYAAHLYEAALQDTAKAVEEYAKVVGQFPQTREARQALWRMGRRYHTVLHDTSEALVAYERFARRYQGSEQAQEARQHKQALLDALGRRQQQQ